MKTPPEKYDHSEAESRWHDTWEQKQVYRWDSSLTRDETYVIDTPPPTVSGMLHMGHIYSYTQADFIVRYQRMSGKTVFYPMGFDDNGLPTERLVEKAKKVRASDLSREDFIELCMGVSEEARKEFRELFSSIALSVDWNEEYHTVSEQSRRISQMSFLDLFGNSHAYRKLQPMLWDPVDQTAIAQAEVEDKEQPSFFNDIHFAIDGSDEKIVVATTRPELLPACVAVFYHPEDVRYQHLRGKFAVTPLFGVKVPVIEDEAVEPEKGTGIMMCCTFGDEADIEKWRKHDLPTRVILNKYGKIEGLEGAHADSLNGLKAKAAREKTIELLEASGDLLDSKPIIHAVKCAERSGAPLEILPTYQWFIRVLDQKEALKAKADEANWYPKYMQVRMNQWIEGLSWDWCISRQRYFGVPFPVWYVQQVEVQNYSASTEKGAFVHGLQYNPVGAEEIIVPTIDMLPLNPLDTDTTKEFFEKLGYKYQRFDALGGNSGPNPAAEFSQIFEKEGKIYIVRPDADVMDTWATSSISPQLSSRSINANLRDGTAERHAKLFPADLRPQAHEIIRTWAFYTLVKAYLHEDVVPWKNLMISGWCLASDKTKMSKSKGNVVTPVDLIRNKSADVVRYWASTSKLGTDTAFSEDVLKIGKKLVNKLWNATKFAAIHLEKLDKAPVSAIDDVKNGCITEVLDKWVLTRLHRAVSKATADFEKYEYSDARNAAEDFFWNDFCDNYLELVKNRVYGNEGTAAAQMSAVYTIYYCLDGILKLFAPFVPHITEELFSYIFEEDFEKHGSIHARHMWPQANYYPCDAEAEIVGIDCVNLLESVRKHKSERNVSIKYPLEKIAVHVQQIYALEPMLKGAFADLKGATNAAQVDWGVMQGGDSSRMATTKTEDNKFIVSVLFAEQSDVA